VSTSADRRFLDLADTLLVGRLERLEGAHEVVEGIGHVVARATRGGVARGLGFDVFGGNVFGQMLFAHVILFLGASLRKGARKRCPALPRSSALQNVRF
jgi:hypothetical protein